AGELDDAALEAHWRHASIYAAAARLEGYGMAVAEALARALPVVTTHAGATGDWLSRDAAFVAPGGDINALRDALRRLLTDPALRQRYADAALAFAQTLPSWRNTAVVVNSALAAL